MPSSFQDFFFLFLDTLTGHIILTAFLFTMMDERIEWNRLKKLPLLFILPVAATVIGIVLFGVMPEAQIVRYALNSMFILLMCTLWTMWTWRINFWRAFSSVCMAGILQIATTALTQCLVQMLFPENETPLALLIGISSISFFAAALLLKGVHFEIYFRLLLEDNANPHRTALLIFALESVMDTFLVLQIGLQSQYLMAYYLLVVSLVILMAGLIIYLAQRFDIFRKFQAQQDVIFQQQLYEQDLEAIRQEVRTFRHDYKNLLTGLSQQAGAGELDQLCATLSELNAGFDQRFGEKIQASTQIGNLQIPQMRSLLLSKLTAMREKGVECRLEILYPISDINMDIWDFVRCLGILIDNAVEAVEGRDHPWVEIILLAQEGQVNLRVSNPWNGVANPARFWEEGWSTKGINRGLGLSSYVRILARYANVSRCTSWTNGVFLQELTVGGAS